MQKKKKIKAGGSCGSPVKCDKQNKNDARFDPQPGKTLKKMFLRLGSDAQNKLKQNFVDHFSIRREWKKSFNNFQLWPY